MCVNEALKTGPFPNSLKYANVRSIYKNVDPFHKKNYRPVSILPLLLKVYERVIYEQIKLFLYAITGIQFDKIKNYQKLILDIGKIK